MKAGKWEKKKFGGREISGKTLGIIGLGTIGSIVADRANGLKMNILAYDPVVSEERAVELGAKLVSLDELFVQVGRHHHPHPAQRAHEAHRQRRGDREDEGRA